MRMRSRYYCTNPECRTMHCRTLGGGREDEPCRVCGAPCERTTRIAGGVPAIDDRTVVVWVRVSPATARMLVERGPSMSRAAGDIIEAQLGGGA